MLDSTIVIDYLRGQPDARARVVRLFEEGDQPVVNAIVVCEVRAGLNAGDVAAFDALLGADRVRPTRSRLGEAGG